TPHWRGSRKAGYTSLECPHVRSGGRWRKGPEARPGSFELERRARSARKLRDRRTPRYAFPSAERYSIRRQHPHRNEEDQVSIQSGRVVHRGTGQHSFAGSIAQPSSDAGNLLSVLLPGIGSKAVYRSRRTGGAIRLRFGSRKVTTRFAESFCTICR